MKRVRGRLLRSSIWTLVQKRLVGICIFRRGKGAKAFAGLWPSVFDTHSASGWWFLLLDTSLTCAAIPAQQRAGIRTECCSHLGENWRCTHAMRSCSLFSFGTTVCSTRNQALPMCVSWRFLRCYPLTLLYRRSSCGRCRRARGEGHEHGSVRVRGGRS